MTTHETNPDRTYQLQAARGEIDTEGAINMVQAMHMAKNPEGEA